LVRFGFRYSNFEFYKVMSQKHSKKSRSFKLIVIFAIIAAIPLTVLMSQRQQNVKQEASTAGGVGTACVSDTSCNPGLACTNYKCSPSSSDPLGTYQKEGDYLCTRCSNTNKYCYATWHEGDIKCDRNNVISDTTYNIDCNCKTGTNKGVCPDGKSTAKCGN